MLLLLWVEHELEEVDVDAFVEVARVEGEVEFARGGVEQEVVPRVDKKVEARDFRVQVASYWILSLSIKLLHPSQPLSDAYWLPSPSCVDTSLLDPEFIEPSRPKNLVLLPDLGKLIRMPEVNSDPNYVVIVQGLLDLNELVREDLQRVARRPETRVVTVQKEAGLGTMAVLKGLIFWMF